MSINRSALAVMLRAAARRWRQGADQLCEIDSRFGDGDHGVAMGKIAALVEARLEAWPADVSLKAFLEDLGGGVMAVGGGSSGPLYGTLIEGLAGPLGDETEVDAPRLKAMLAAGLASLRDITTARVGDKTMMDALIPAVAAGQAAGDDVREVLAEAARAAAQGARDSEGFVSKFGRARSYGQRTIGTPDAGALSTALFFQGLMEGLADY